MTTPRFSILIPTRNRRGTLMFALETALAQTHDAFEVVVMDNHCSDGTTEYLEGLTHPRLRHVRSDGPLSMSSNWELGLSHCRGEYVTVIGDDDGLMPDAVAFGEAAVRQSGAEVVTWTPHTYWWPDTIVEAQRNMLYVQLAGGNDGSIESSGATLEHYYAFRVFFDALPMIYNSWVSRRVIDRVIAQVGRYFCTEAPDLFSGIANCAVTPSFLRIGRPLGIRGTSGKSNGTAYFVRSKGGALREQVLSEAGLTLDDIVHADLTATPIIELFVASINALSRDLLFPGHPRYVVDLEAAIRMAVAGLARDPDSYDENIADIRALCVKRGIDVSKFPMPPKQSAPPAASRGPTFTQRQITGVAVDGTMAGLATIADAVRLTSAMTFPSGL